MALSEREKTIARRYADGETYKQIAAELHIAPSTVRNHLAAIYRKLDVTNKLELARKIAASLSAKETLPSPKTPARTGEILRNLNQTGPPARAGASIAVMPFSSIGSGSVDYIGHGIAANIQHELTRHPDLLVTGRGSCLAMSKQSDDATLAARKLGVQYVLQGTVRAQRDAIRLIVELVDGTSGRVLWSERQDRVFNDILICEAEVARAVSGSLSLQIDEAQFARHRHLDADQLTAYGWRLRGNHLLELGGKQNIVEAEECFRNALSLEPDSAAATARLSMCYGYECHLLLTDDYAASLAHHFELAEKAIALDHADSRAQHAMSCALILSGQYERAAMHAALGVEISPGEYHNLCNRGYSLFTLGRIDESISYFTESLRTNPLAPNSCLFAVGLIEYLEANYGQSANALSRMSGYHVQRASTLAAACAQAGYVDTAHSAAQEFREVSTEIPICPTVSEQSNWPDFWRRVYPYLNSDALAHMLDGLSKAALPV